MSADVKIFGERLLTEQERQKIANEEPATNEQNIRTAHLMTMRARIKVQSEDCLQNMKPIYNFENE